MDASQPSGTLRTEPEDTNQEFQSEDQPPIYTDADAGELLGQYPPPPPNCQPLCLPVCLPQITTGYDSPFARAYNPELVNSGINEEDWLRFLDGLNIAITASPPLRVVNMAGMVIGFIPYHWTMIASVVIQTTAQTALRVLSKTLTDRYLQKANSEYFEPRGLKVRLMKTAAMRKFVHIDEDTGGAGPSKAKKFAKAAGRTAESLALRIPLPIIGRIVSMIPSSTPTVDLNAPKDMTHRRLEQMEGYIMPVVTDVPPAKTPDSLLDKTSELAIKLRKWEASRSDKKGMKARRKLAVMEGRLPASELNEGGWGVRRVLSEVRGNSRRDVTKVRGEVAKADRLEYISTDALIWVVLMNAEQDRVIEGTEIVDSSADTEAVANSDWENELRREDEEVLAEAREGPLLRVPYAYSAE